MNFSVKIFRISNLSFFKTFQTFQTFPSKRSYEFIYTLVSNGGTVVPLLSTGTNNVVSSPVTVFSGAPHHLRMMVLPHFIRYDICLDDALVVVLVVVVPVPITM